MFNKPVDHSVQIAMIKGNLTLKVMAPDGICDTAVVTKDLLSQWEADPESAVVETENCFLHVHEPMIGDMRVFYNIWDACNGNEPTYRLAVSQYFNNREQSQH